MLPSSRALWMSSGFIAALALGCAGGAEEESELVGLVEGVPCEPLLDAGVVTTDGGGEVAEVAPDAAIPVDPNAPHIREVFANGSGCPKATSRRRSRRRTEHRRERSTRTRRSSMGRRARRGRTVWGALRARAGGHAVRAERVATRARRSRAGSAPSPRVHTFRVARSEGELASIERGPDQTERGRRSHGDCVVSGKKDSLMPAALAHPGAGKGDSESVIRMPSARVRSPGAPDVSGERQRAAPAEESVLGERLKSAAACAGIERTVRPPHPPRFHGPPLQDIRCSDYEGLFGSPPRSSRGCHRWAVSTRCRTLPIQAGRSSTRDS